MQQRSTLNQSRLFCPITKCFDDLSFSLVDYKNNYFTSNYPSKIIEFYDGFENSDQLIQWMRERPTGVANIYEVDGDKEIVVVIPTADFNGKYARECKDNIFKGLHMVFVESGGKEDFYFNYAHNVNVGIRKVMEYDPKWIVVSNDDMKKIDDIERLRTELNKFSPDDKLVIFSCTDGRYHSRPVSVSFRTYRRGLILLLKERSERSVLHFESKFNVKYVIGSTLGLYKLIYKPRLQFKYTGSFAIFSIGLAKMYNGVFYDEVYINGIEDIDQSWKFKQEHVQEKCVEYRIDDYIGGTIGPYNTNRRLRSLLNGSYLNSKIESGELKFF